MVRRRPGRVEAALDRELRDRADVGAAERAALRVAARALDLAERTYTLNAVDALSRTYLDLRLAAGLSLRTRPQSSNDPFEQLLRDINADARVRHGEDSGPAN